MPEYMNAEDDNIDVKGWILRILRIWPWFFITGTLALTIGWFYLRYTEPVYQSVAAILVKDEKKGGGSVLDNPLLEELNIGGKGKLVENEIEVLRSFNLLKDVVLKNQLYTTVKNRGRIASWTVYGANLPFQLEIENPEKIDQGYLWVLNVISNTWQIKTSENGNFKDIERGKWYLFNKIRFRVWPNVNYHKPIEKDAIEKRPEFEIYLQPIQGSTEHLKELLEVSPVGKLGSVISLSLTDLDNNKATDVLTSIIEEYNHQGLTDKNEMNANTIGFLTDRLKVVERELKSVEGQVENFKRANRITNVSAEADAYLKTAQEIDRLNADQQTRVNIINELERELLQNQNNPQLVPSSLGIADIPLTGLIQRHNDLILERDRLIEKTGVKNPLLIDVDIQVRDIRRSLLENVKNLKAGYQIALRDINQENYKLSAKLQNIPALEKNLIQISRDRNVQEQLYMFLLQKREESAVALASSVKDSRTIEDPRSIGQIRPNKMRILAIAGALGLLFPLILLLIRDFFDDKIGTRKQVEKACTSPLLGEIGFVPNMDGPIEIKPKSRSAVSEQLRVIRTAIGYTAMGDKVKTIMITSHQPGEGKSFSCLNLGASLALLEKKVVILEFDLRKPRLMRNLGLTADEGISNYLTGNLNLNNILVEVPDYDGNFYVLPTGPIPPNPAELILGPHMQTLIDELRARFDYIIIDSPPFSIVTDSTLLQKYADIGIIILRQGYTTKEALNDINERKVLYPDFPLYTILNGVGKTSKYSYYGSKYGGKYGYGYYGETPETWSEKIKNFFKK